MYNNCTICTFVKRTHMSQITLEVITAAVCSQLNVSPDDLQVNKKRSSKALLSAKQIITYLSKKHTDTTNKTLLRALGYNSKVYKFGVDAKSLRQNIKAVHNIISIYPEDNEFRMHLKAIEQALTIGL